MLEGGTIFPLSTWTQRAPYCRADSSEPQACRRGDTDAASALLLQGVVDAHEARREHGNKRGGIAACWSNIAFPAGHLAFFSVY